MRHFWKCWMLAIVLLFAVCHIAYGEPPELPIAPTPVCYGYTVIVPYLTAEANWWNGVAFSNHTLIDNKIKMFYGHQLLGFTVPAMSVVTQAVYPDEDIFMEVYSCRPIDFQFFIGSGFGYDSTLYETEPRD